MKPIQKNIIAHATALLILSIVFSMIISLATRYTPFVVCSLALFVLSAVIIVAATTDVSDFVEYVGITIGAYFVWAITAIFYGIAGGGIAYYCVSAEHTGINNINLMSNGSMLALLIIGGLIAAITVSIRKVTMAAIKITKEQHSRWKLIKASKLAY